MKTDKIFLYFIGLIRSITHENEESEEERFVLILQKQRDIDDRQMNKQIQKKCTYFFSHAKSKIKKNSSESLFIFVQPSQCRTSYWLTYFHWCLHQHHGMNPNRSFRINVWIRLCDENKIEKEKEHWFTNEPAHAQAHIDRIK